MPKQQWPSLTGQACNSLLRQYFVLTQTTLMRWHTLLPPDENRIKSALPLANRAVLFETSERSWHGFEEVSPPAGREELSRRSFAIYLYTAERPPEETAPPQHALARRSSTVR